MNIHKIKYLAVLSMIFDHMASVLFASDAIGYIILKLIGRIAAPAMCFALAQGFIHTSNRKKYFLRLIIFAVISQNSLLLLHEWYTMVSYWEYVIYLSLFFLTSRNFRTSQALRNSFDTYCNQHFIYSNLHRLVYLRTTIYSILLSK